jgi:hypothetical protein
MTIILNAFPVINRNYNGQAVSKQEITDVISLSSGIGEEFLEIDHISGIGKYTIEPVKKKEIDGSRIFDYLERLLDVVQDEKTAFPEIDNEKIVEVYNAISSIQEKGTLKVELNRLREYAEVARLAIDREITPHKINMSWWTTHAEAANGIPEETTLMAHKHPELNKTDAFLLTPVDGGRSFYDDESLKAINKFYLTAKDRILTKNDILNFCRIELGKYVQNIQTVRNVRVSPKCNEGMVNVIEIRIKPLPEYVEYLKSGGILKDLRIRLMQRSPDTFNYRIILS